MCATCVSIVPHRLRPWAVCVFCVDYGSPGFCLCLRGEDTIWAPLVSSGCLFQSLSLYLFFLPTDKQPISAGASSCRGRGTWRVPWPQGMRALAPMAKTYTHSDTHTFAPQRKCVFKGEKRNLLFFFRSFTTLTPLQLYRSMVLPASPNYI